MSADRTSGFKPIEPKPDTLAKLLERKPVLWVGAGLSVAAGYPSTWKLVEAMKKVALDSDSIDTSLPFFKVADAFLAAEGQATLGELLQKSLGQPRRPTASHRALARLAGAGDFHAIVTTNYDPLIEHTFNELGISHVLQPLEDNAPITGEGALRILKIHGSYDDWERVVLSGQAYTEFGQRYPFLEKQLYVLLRQRPLLFTGCSLQDPRILNWIAALPDDAARSLHVWSALLTQSDWDAVLKYRYQDGGIERNARELLARINFRPILIKDHDALPRLLSELAAVRVPLGSSRFEINLYTDHGLRASTEGCADWTPSDPLADPNLARDLNRLRVLADTALPTDARGNIRPEAKAIETELRALSVRVGEALAEALLSVQSRARLQATLNASTGGAPPLLQLRVHAEDHSDDARRRADRLLALPWELLRLNGEFPVERSALDIAREAVVEKTEGLEPPDRELTVVATVAAPVNAVRLDYEHECYRLWRAMGKEERRLLITDTGTAETLIDALKAHEPVALHFTGHGDPGTLFFEDDAACTAPLPVRDLVARLRSGIHRLPRLAFLASCYSASIERSAPASGDHRMVDPAVVQLDPASSSAAELHREGIHQVVAWLGPVGDAQCTRAEEVFYAALVRGRSAREAVREVRQHCRQPLRHGADATHAYPLGWAQVVLYHRGEDVPTALPATKVGSDLGRSERKRLHERLDRMEPSPGDESRSSRPGGVERLKFGFVGRRTVRAELIRRFRQDGQRALIVHGLGGLGKTALCAELVPILARALGSRDAGGRPLPAHAVVLDGRFAGERSEPVTTLWEQVQQFGEGAAWNEVLANLQRDGLTGAALVAALVWLGRQRGGLLVYLDDAESLQQPLSQGELGVWKHPALKEFWKALLDASEREERFALLASTRYVPEETPQSACYPLPVMREIDLVRLIPWWPAFSGLLADDIAWLAERVDGHPRSLEWLDGFVREKVDKAGLAAPGLAYAGLVTKDLIESILPSRNVKLSADLVLPWLLDAVGGEAKAHLRRCGVLEEPAPWGAVKALEDQEGSSKQLALAGLLSAFEPPYGGEPRWAPHRTVVEAVRRLEGRDCLDAHRRLGEWFKRQWKGQETALGLAASAARHLCSASVGNDAWAPAQQVLLALRGAGRYREALGWVERALAAGVSGAIRGNALAFEVQLQMRCGEVRKNAEERLKEAVGLVDDTDKSFVLDQLGGLFMWKGRVAEAAEVLTKSLALAVSLTGEEHPDVAASLHALAGVLKAQGDLAGARERLERTLRILARLYGTEEHPDVAASLHALAVVLQVQGDLAGARERLERALRIKARLHGTEEHSDVAASLHALAGVLQAQGDLAGARERLEHVLRILARLYGTEEHPDVAASLHALAGVLHAQGDLTGARERLERVLRILARLYGTEEHPNVAASLHALAGVLRAQGDLAGAREHLERALRILARLYGTEEHPQVAASLHALAGVLHAQGDLAGARERLERALRIEARVYGTEEHPNVAASLHALAGVLHAQGDLAGARERLERVLRILARLYGTEEHPQVAASLHELAGVLHAQGDLAGARERLERVLRIEARLYSTEEHSDVAASLHALAGVLHAQGDLAGARERLERVLRIEARLYGTSEHPSTAVTEMNLALLLRQLGEEDSRAYELLEHAYQVFLTHLGPDHQYTRELAALVGSK
ncbi:tetratricopeptide repeat protein [Pyxidicoccus trucidator]|uniref:tetratricopeptide repeat protein n=1 Tax=Pyxidicoccus trucidator TaxID=2709662 RepID=UPI0013DB1281|nr:tetratricopeptide repeat protein [Pyxidicoccus trucidator]